MATAYPTVPGVRFKLVDELPGYEQFAGYCVGNDASAWSNHRQGPGTKPGAWRQIKPTRHKNGYLTVTLRSSQTVKMFKLHILLLEAFVGPRPAGMDACHFPDPDPYNCALWNLRWGTKSENMQHKKLQGTWQGGSNNPRAKLSEADVVEIRRLFAAQTNKQDKITLARKFGVSRTLIRLIVNGRIWGHVMPSECPLRILRGGRVEEVIEPEEA